MSKPEIIAALDPLLQRAGFHRRNVVWNRQRGYLVDVVDFQISKDGEAATLNVGVLDKEAYRVFWGKALPQTAQQPDCPVRARVGELLEGGDVWWPLSAKDGPMRMAEAVEDTLLPFLQRVDSREGMVNYLREPGVLKLHYPMPIVYLAILEHFLGRASEGCELLKRFVKTPPNAWSGKVSAIGQRLGCMSTARTVPI